MLSTAFSVPNHYNDVQIQKLCSANPRNGTPAPSISLVLLRCGPALPTTRSYRRGALLAAHLCHRRRLSPLFLASRLRDQPRVPVRRSPSSRRAPPKKACCGGHPSIDIITCTPIRENDVHSPRHKGFLYSHLGWIFSRRHDATDLVKVADFARYPELMWLHKLRARAGCRARRACFLIAGWSGLVVGFFWSTVLVYHATFCINSLAHVRGRKRYVTGDNSRNNWLLALFTMGEGWHNNHHAYQSSVRQGFRWWEIDATFYLLKALSWTGLVWDLKTPPEAVRRNEHRLGSRVVERAAAQLAGSFDTELIVNAITAAINGPGLLALQQKLAGAHNCAADVLASWQLPHLPTRHELVARARAMFADTPSLEDIVGCAHALHSESDRYRLFAPTPDASGVATGRPQPLLPNPR